ncbi:MAG: hypothetical protein JRJ79_15590 [Deltaproteobacteria bacterium]|nr:hypothetical protein [Deltaproteobacteria bacterium]
MATGSTTGRRPRGSLCDRDVVVLSCYAKYIMTFGIIRCATLGHPVEIAAGQAIVEVNTTSSIYDRHLAAIQIIGDSTLMRMAAHAGVYQKGTIWRGAIWCPVRRHPTPTLAVVHGMAVGALTSYLCRGRAGKGRNEGYGRQCNG